MARRRPRLQSLGSDVSESDAFSAHPRAGLGLLTPSGVTWPRRMKLRCTPWQQDTLPTGEGLRKLRWLGGDVSEPTRSASVNLDYQCAWHARVLQSHDFSTRCMARLAPPSNPCSREGCGWQFKGLILRLPCIVLSRSTGFKGWAYRYFPLFCRLFPQNLPLFSANRNVHISARLYRIQFRCSRSHD